MNNFIHLLIYEDSLEDVELIQRQLDRLNLPLVYFHADQEQTFKSILETKEIQIILADYAVVGFNGMQALLHVIEYYPEVIFIFVTGTLNNEELAAQTILNGAADFVLKTNLRRLGHVVKACWEARQKKQKTHPNHDRNKRINAISERVHQQILANDAVIQRTQDYLRHTSSKREMVNLLLAQLKESNQKLERIQEDLEQ